MIPMVTQSTGTTVEDYLYPKDFEPGDRVVHHWRVDDDGVHHCIASELVKDGVAPATAETCDRLHRLDADNFGPSPKVGPFP